MPTTKQTRKTRTQTSKNNASNVSTTPVVTAPPSTPVGSDSHEAPLPTQSHEKSKKSVKKAGRTILVRTVSGAPLASSVFDGLEGLQSRTETKSSTSWFLTFDNADHSLAAFKKLRSESSDYRVKFSYYRIFFTMTGLTDTTDYNQAKTALMNYVTEKSGSTPLYCKLYRKESKYIGCGDFTVDTLESMNSLISKEGGLRDFTFGSYSGSFYRYNPRKDRTLVPAVSVDA